MVDVTKECGAEIWTDTTLDRVHRLREREIMYEWHMWRYGVWISHKKKKMQKIKVSKK